MAQHVLLYHNPGLHNFLFCTLSFYSVSETFSTLIVFLDLYLFSDSISFINPSLTLIFVSMSKHS